MNVYAATLWAVHSLPYIVKKKKVIFYFCEAFHFQGEFENSSYPTREMSMPSKHIATFQQSISSCPPPPSALPMSLLPQNSKLSNCFFFSLFSLQSLLENEFINYNPFSSFFFCPFYNFFAIHLCTYTLYMTT